MKVLGITILALVALFTGGCSLYFLAFVGSASFLFSGPGLVIAALCGLWIYALVSKGPKA